MKIYNDVCFDKNHFRRTFVVYFRCIFPQLKSCGIIRRKVSLKIKICLFPSTYDSAKSFVENLRRLFWCLGASLIFGENFSWKWNVCLRCENFQRKCNMSVFYKLFFVEIYNEKLQRKRYVWRLFTLQTFTIKMEYVCFRQLSFRYKFTTKIYNENWMPVLGLNQQTSRIYKLRLTQLDHYRTMIQREWS